jgi:hypothetical protein
MKQLRMGGNTEYADVDALRKEVTEARRLCAQRDSPVIDATYRSNGGVIIDLLRSAGGISPRHRDERPPGPPRHVLEEARLTGASGTLQHHQQSPFPGRLEDLDLVPLRL